MPLREEFHTHL